jgi:hypothetical protein
MKMFIAITEFLIALVGFNTGGKVDISTDLLCDNKIPSHSARSLHCLPVFNF